jgi:Protein of unknown function (DUF3224)
MHATSTFTTSDIKPEERETTVATGVDVGLMTFAKTFVGDIDGRAETLFTSAYSYATGTGTYLAMESFAGTIAGRSGTVNIAHTATTTGEDRSHHLMVIVPTSGTGELTGITGTGSLDIDPDGTHHFTLDYELPT